MHATRAPLTYTFMQHLRRPRALAALVLGAAAVVCLSLDLLTPRTPAARRAEVCLFLFNKDATGLLTYWLDHHLSLFDAAKLTIIDQASVEPKTHAILDLAAARGVHVIAFPGSYKQRTAVMSRTMRAAAASCDFLVPLDNDELLGLHSGGEYHVSRTAIEAEFTRLLPTIKSGVASLWTSLWTGGLPGRYKLGDAPALLCDHGACMGRRAADDVASRAPRLLLRRPTGLADRPSGELCMDKTFFAARSFESIDHGNHYGQLRGDHGHRDVSRRLCGVTMRTSLYFPRQHRLVLMHLASALPHDWYRSKILRAVAAYNFTSRTNCATVSWGQPYCEALGTGALFNASQYCVKMQAQCATEREIGGVFAPRTLLQHRYIISAAAARGRAGDAPSPQPVPRRNASLL